MGTLLVTGLVRSFIYMLRKLKIDAKTYNSIFEKYPKYIEYVEDLKNYFLRGYKDKNKIKVDSATRTLIIQGYRLNTEECEVIAPENDWQQVVCVLDDSLDGIQEADKVPWASVANKKIYTMLGKYYSSEEIENLLNSHSCEWDKQLHQLLPTVYHDGKIHKFTNCVYYDINKAHTDALCEIFPLAKTAILRLEKSYINIFVGDLVNHGHRGCFNWIVRRTRTKLEDVMNKVGGCAIYINTDGAIIYRPECVLPTSKEIGDIKSESVDGIVYAYVCPKDKDTTPYTLYQYTHPEKGKQMKGNSRLAIRESMDLSKGIVNKGKVTRIDAREIIENFRTEKVEIYEE